MLDTPILKDPTHVNPHRLPVSIDPNFDTVCLMAIRFLSLLALSLLAFSSLPAADWPMWRGDPGRTATTSETLPETLALLWSRQLPASAPAYSDVRLRFDAAAEPVVLGKRLFIASNTDDSLTAYDTETGVELWKTFADGPIRFAPVAGGGRVIFGSDDGCVYCVKASDGSPVWKIRAVPSERRVLGNGRLISVWPVRGGPVLHGGRVYFAAGVWPLEGTFVFCVDAATGETIWRNDRASYLYGIHPHDAESFGGLAPQGYLLVEGEDLVVPSSQAYPARFDLKTGKLKEFALPAPGRLPGGWFASTPAAQEEDRLKRRGLLFDAEVNASLHEDKMRNEGLPEIRTTIRTARREWKFTDPLPGVEGTVHSIAAADGKLIVSTLEGNLFCLGEKKVAAEPVRYALPQSKAHPPGSDFPTSPPLPKHGFAVVLGLNHADRLAHLETEPTRQIVAIDSRSDRVKSQRQQGWIGGRAHFLEADPAAIELPPYFADLIVIDESLSLDAAALARHYRALRPFGGRILGKGATLAEAAKSADLSRAAISDAEGWTLIVREGPLEGATNYTGDWAASEDQLVRAPLGLLWYGDSIKHFKRSPQPKFIDGVMISNPKDWTDASTRKGPVDYRLLETVFTDVYTGRVLAPEEAPELRQSFAEVDQVTIQPSQYRPPRQKDDWKPEAPVAGERVNPLTGETEPRSFPKSYGCDGGVDYGLLYSMRSGTPAFYDKRFESGTINISGPRSGCTNSVIPANGVLNLPYFYEGCTCAYPLPMALSLVSMPETFEQWASWGAAEPETLSGKLQRIGLNFGAPGDRVTHDGTLWLDLPNVGGPSPDLELATEPPLKELQTFYQHSLFLKGGKGWPWVAGSGVLGLRTVTLSGLKPGDYTIRLTFSEPDETTKAGERVFGIALNGKSIAEAFDPVSAAQGAHRAATLEIPGIAIAESGELRIELRAGTGVPVLSGVEILRQGLTFSPIPQG
jgi:hypothetical protein